VKALTPFLD